MIDIIVDLNDRKVHQEKFPKFNKSYIRDDFKLNIKESKYIFLLAALKSFSNN